MFWRDSNNYLIPDIQGCINRFNGFNKEASNIEDSIGSS